MFIALHDISEKNGPLTVLPKDLTKKVYEKLLLDGVLRKRNSKISDNSIEKVLGQSISEVAIPITLKKYSAAIVDTSKCYHFGSRPPKDGSGQPRRMINLIYVPWHSPELPFSSITDGIDTNKVVELVEQSFTNKFLR